MKECLKCHRMLPDEAFSKDPCRRDGLHRYCKACRRKAYRQRNGQGAERLLDYSTDELIWALRQKGVNVKINYINNQ